MTLFEHELPGSTSCSCMNCFTGLFDKIKNAVRGKNNNNKYQTKRKDLNSRLILGDDY